MEEKSYLMEAFTKLKELNEDAFTLGNEGDWEKANDLINAPEENVEEIIDPLAETEEELQTSYVGNVILDCVVCQSKIYKKPEEVIVDEEASLANIEETCPYCQSNDGFKIIGQVAEYKPGEEEEEGSEEDEKPKEDDYHKEDEEENIGSEDSLENEDKPLMEAISNGSITKKLKKTNSKNSKKTNKKLSESINKTPMTNMEKIMNILEENKEEKAVLPNNSNDGKLKEAIGDKKTNKDIYLQWVADSDKWLDLVPNPKKEEDDTEAFEEAFEDSWNESGGGSGVCINEDGLLLPDGSEISDLNITKGKNDFIKAVRDRNLYSLFGYTKEEFEDSLKNKNIIDVITSKQINPSTITLNSIKNHIKSFVATWNECLKDYEDDDMDESIKTKKGIRKISSLKEEDKPTELLDTEEIISPVSEEAKDKIKTNNDQNEDEYKDIDIQEFDEEEFDSLGENYLKKVYENVKSYKTTSGKINGNQLFLEGVINFKSGKEAKTNFIFEAKSITKDGKVKFLGENKQFARGNKSFMLTGKLNNNKLLSESLQYNYRGKDKDGSSKHIYGRASK